MMISKACPDGMAVDEVFAHYEEKEQKRLESFDEK